MDMSKMKRQPVFGVVNIRDCLHTQNDDVVTRLEALLHLAKEGKVKRIAYAYVDQDTDSVTGWSSGSASSWYALVAGISSILHQMHTRP
jgi:hypothetical protein